MSEDTTTVEEGVEESSAKSQAEDKIAERLESLRQEVSQQGSLQQLSADPDVRKVLELKAAGKLVDIGESLPNQEPIAEMPEAPDVPLADLDNGEFMSIMEKVVDAKFQQLMPETIKASTKDLTGKVDELMSWAARQNAETVKDQGKDLQSKYSDFMQWKDQMVSLDEETGGRLGLEDLYRLAKTRAGSPIEPQRGMSSERPSSTPPTARRVRDPKKEGEESNGKMKSGRAGFVSRLHSLEIEAPGT